MSETMEMEMNVELFPSEMLCRVFRALDHASLVRAGWVCSSWRRVARHPALWRHRSLTSMLTGPHPQAQEDHSASIADTSVSTIDYSSPWSIDSSASSIDSSASIIDSSVLRDESSSSIIDSSASMADRSVSMIDCSVSKIDSSVSKIDSSVSKIDSPDVAVLVLGAAPCLGEVIVRTPSQRQLRALQRTQCKIASLTLLPLGPEASVPLLESLQLLLRNVAPSLRNLDLRFAVPLSLVPLIDSLPSLERFACDDIELNWPGEAASPIEDESASESSELSTTFEVEVVRHSQRYCLNFTGASVPVRERRGDDVGLKHLDVRSCSDVACFPTVFALIRAHRSSLLSVACGSRPLVKEPLGTLLRNLMDHMVLSLSACLHLESVSVGLSENLGLLGELPRLRRLELQVSSPRVCHLLAGLPRRLRSLRVELLFPLRRSHLLKITAPLVELAPSLSALEDLFISVLRGRRAHMSELEALLKAHLLGVNVAVRNEEGEEGDGDDGDVNDDDNEDEEEEEVSNDFLNSVLSSFIQPSLEDILLSLLQNT